MFCAPSGALFFDCTSRSISMQQALSFLTAIVHRTGAAAGRDQTSLPAPASNNV
jgi:hypothetical protein